MAHFHLRCCIRREILVLSVFRCFRHLSFVCFFLLPVRLWSICVVTWSLAEEKQNGRLRRHANDIWNDQVFSKYSAIRCSLEDTQGATMSSDSQTLQAKYQKLAAEFAKVLNRESRQNITAICVKLTLLEWLRFIKDLFPRSFT